MDIAILNVLSNLHGVLKGMEQLLCKNYFEMGTTADLQLDQPYGVGTTIVNYEDLTILQVEMDVRKKGEFEICSDRYPRI